MVNLQEYITNYLIERFEMSNDLIIINIDESLTKLMNDFDDTENMDQLEIKLDDSRLFRIDSNDHELLELYNFESKKTLVKFVEISSQASKPIVTTSVKS